MAKLNVKAIREHLKGVHDMLDEWQERAEIEKAAKVNDPTAMDSKPKRIPSPLPGNIAGRLAATGSGSDGVIVNGRPHVRNR